MRAKGVILTVLDPSQQKRRGEQVDDERILVLAVSEACYAGCERESKTEGQK